MKKYKHIHNLDTLEKEIYRQALLAKKSQKKLEENLEYLNHNLFTLAGNFWKKEGIKREGNSSFFDQVFANEHVQQAVSGMTGRIADHMAEAVNHLVDRIFQKHK